MNEEANLKLNGPTRQAIIEADRYFDAARFADALKIVDTLAEVWLHQLREADESAGEVLRTVVASRLDDIASALASQFSFSRDDALLDTAEEALDRLAHVFRALGVLHFAVTTHGRFALTCLRHGDWERSVRIFAERVLPNAVEVDDLDNEIGTLMNLVSILETHSRVGEALAYLQTGIRHALERGSAAHVRQALDLAHRVLVKHQDGQSLRADLAEFRRFAAAAGEFELEGQFRRLSGDGEGDKRDSERFRFKRRRVFISYSRTDTEIVRNVIHFLRSPSTEVYVDEESLIPGREWDRDLSTLIDAADVLVVIVGANTFERPIVLKEIDQFRTAQVPSARPIVPVLVDGATSTGELGGYQWIDLRGHCSPTRIAAKAGAVLRAVFESTTHHSHEYERGLSIVTKTPDQGFEEKLNAGDFMLPPAALVSMVNLGILSTGQTCGWHVDPFRTSVCGKPVRYVCVGCAQGRCDEGAHISDGFLTRVSSDDDRYQGLLAFCWCSSCRAPVCASCSQMEALTRRISDLFLSRVPCPACRSPLQMTPLFSDREDFGASAFGAWIRCQGPPGPLSDLEPETRDSSLIDAVDGALYTAACDLLRTIVVGGELGVLEYDLERRAELRRLPLEGPVGAVAVSGQYLVAGSASGELHIFRRVTETADAVFKHRDGGSVTAISLRQHSDSIQIVWGGAVAMFSGFLLLSDVRTGQTRHLIEAPGRVLSVALNPSGDMVAYTAFDEPIRLLELDTGRVLHELRTPDERKWQVAFSPDGRILASAGGDDETVHIWDVMTGQHLNALGGHVGAVTTVAFHPSGMLLASGGSDGLRLWALLSDPPTTCWAKGRHAGAVQSVAFSGDGQFLVSVCNQGELRVWHDELHGLLDSSDEWVKRLRGGSAS